MSTPLPVRPGARVGPYEITSPIGEGGMGAVYKARDTRLGRTVALKFLKTSNASRFLREAQAIAALNHPNICTLYDAGPDYLVMEYLEGSPLAGPLATALALRYASEVAAAMEAAHTRGIIHRDLKPANVLVTASGVKVLDFGLAKLEAAVADTPTLTETAAGTILGTAAYMSPEQALGKPADSRSDIFAFGALLYEMLSGRRAFQGPTMVATLAAVLTRDPDPLHDVPPELQRVIDRCLMKDSAARFQTMAEVRRALQKVPEAPADSGSRGTYQPAAAVPVIGQSIAVLPFANMSGDKDNEYFSDGLAEEILTALTRVPNLKVSARTSSFAFRERAQDIRSIASTLDVNTVLEGSVRRSGNRIRVTAQLINAADGYHLWSERYDRELTDVFEVQDEIASAITHALRLKLGSSMDAPQRYLPPFLAYEAFLQGKHELFRTTAASLPRAMEHFGRAIAIDPLYPDPHIELGACLLILWYFGLRPGRDVAPAMRNKVARANELDGRTPRGQAIRGVLAAAHDYAWDEAERLLKAALEERVGTDEEARWCYSSFFLAPHGRFSEGVAMMDDSLRADPLNVTWRGARAHYLNLAGDHDASLEELQRVAEIESDYWIGHLYVAEARFGKGQLTEARAAAEAAHRLAPWHARTIGMLAALLRLTGDTSASERLVTELLTAKEPHRTAAGMLMYSLVVNDVDEAARWYERAIEHREVWVTFHAQSALTAPLRASHHWPGLKGLLKLGNP